MPMPTPEPGQALIRTAASLVSVGTERMVVAFARQSLVGKAQSRPDLVRQVLDKARREGVLTTLDAALNKLDQPMALGYSSAGSIAAVTPELAHFQVGDRVACAGGGFAVHAEYAAIPANLMVKLPDNVDFESAAFATIGAIALQGFRLANPQVGERIAVIGLGLLGLLTVAIAHAAGCYVLGIDLDPKRVALAQQLGAEATLRKQAVEACQVFTRGRGADSVLICADTASDDPVELAGDIARDRASVVAVGAVGFNIPRRTYYHKELNFIVSRSYGPGRYDPNYEEKGHDYPIGYVRWTEQRNIEAFVDLLASRQIDLTPLITHRIPIDEGAKAYDLITGKSKESFLGVVLTYPEAADQKRRVANPTAPLVKLKPGEILALGVLGAGNYAHATFLPVVKKVGGIAPLGIISSSGVSAHHAAKKFGYGFAGSDPDAIFTDPAINMVAILTRHQLHTPQVLRAFEAGKNVFCEKPLAITPQQLAQAAEVLKQDGKPLLMMGFNRRFAPLSVLLKKFVDERTEPLAVRYRVNAGYIPLDHWLHDLEQGGGRIIGEGCHFIDYLTFLVGSVPISVTAFGLPELGKYNADNVNLVFTFADGSIGSVEYLANGDKAFPKEMVEVFSGGRVAILNDYRTLEMLARGKRTLKRSPLRQDKGHRGGWEAFLNALRNGQQPPIPYAQIIGVTQASFAAVQSLQENRRIEIQTASA